MALMKYKRVTEKVVEYGTAGFREKASLLDHVMYRMGMLAVIRSKKKNGQVIGVMVTASHNPEEDNGLKLVDPYGEMLDSSWEVYANKLANVGDKEVEHAVQEIIQKENVDVNVVGKVFIGEDTRSSSSHLSVITVEGIQSQRGDITNYGVVTTPMLHFFVNCQNTNFQYGEATAVGYFTKLSDAFKTLRGQDYVKDKYTPNIKYDGANGVGAKIMSEMKSYLGDSLDVNIFNNGNGVLNYQCGADYVKVNQKPPENVSVEQNVRYVSVDGDADRIVYYYVDTNNVFHLLDGDRIATLIASYLQQITKQTGLNINLGVVQTAYANGSSTDYVISKLNLPVACTSTGVKNLHHAALKFDIGVYFEANGHGTVLYSNNVQDRVREITKQHGLDTIEGAAARKLLNFIDLTNQTVGDAISDLLLVETILHAKGWSINEWFNMYQDLPNRLQKISVKDRNVIETTDAARKVVKPACLQERIDELVQQYPQGRSFVRSSGTEDVVRIYSEASTQQQADELAVKVSLAVYQLCEGVGASPV